jgi:hypothetical protein
MTIIDDIRAAWGWTGIVPVEIVGESDFGNLMIKDTEGRYWRLCPEDLTCQVVAQTSAELNVLAADENFLRGGT